MNKQTKKIFAQRFKEEREQHHLTQTQVAHQLGYQNYTTITKWEAGTSLPTAEILVAISQLFEVSIDYLLGLSDTTNDDLEEEVIEEQEVLPKSVSEQLTFILTDLESPDSQLAYTTEGQPLDLNIIELLKLSIDNAIQIANR